MSRLMALALLVATCLFPVLKASAQLSPAVGTKIDPGNAEALIGKWVAKCKRDTEPGKYVSERTENLTIEKESDRLKLSGRYPLAYFEPKATGVKFEHSLGVNKINCDYDFSTLKGTCTYEAFANQYEGKSTETCVLERVK